MRNSSPKSRSNINGQSHKVPRLFQNEHGYWHWKPDKRLRPHWKGISLGDNVDRARAEARRLNREADAWLSDRARTIDKSPRVRTGPLTVGQLSGLYRSSPVWKTLRERTRQTYSYELKRLEDEFGHELAASIDEVRVDEWLEVARVHAPQTVRHLASRARSLFEWASRKKYIPRGHNPFKGAGLGSGGKRKFRFLWGDVLHILNTAIEEKRPSVGIALVVGFTCIQRITDVITLTDDHIAPATGAAPARLKFTQSKSAKIGKAGKLDAGFQVNILLPGVISELLSKHRVKSADPECRNWIISEETKAPYHEKTISRVFTRIVAKAIERDPEKWAHLKGGQLRDGRRSGFVHAITQGATVEWVCSISGHTIEQGYDIVEHYLPKTAEQADKASAFMRVSLG
ncbi:hypothetical protein [Chelatococcus asaccharovorans]|uniref:Phage integrase family protein n=1 Tax=Chelatococcus asaccharovorans TaxID=28210 RepID=A0A2V3UAR7_9HYPH|nr:hypothetical protein [Chelatococcus asaccharovorans]MBS7703197.1 hypothetical protein [Chelatococcus asaccharovorans]PXW61527.1 hypothetical protein C7450_10342 [Chelatococcus asaccharovorans]